MSSLSYIPLIAVLLLLITISYMLSQFQNFCVHVRQKVHHERIWTNYFWWNRELIYAVMINFSPNTREILGQVYSCIDQLRLVQPEATRCFKRMVRCQLAVMQQTVATNSDSNGHSPSPLVLQLIEQWKVTAGRLGLLLAAEKDQAPLHTVHVICQSHIDATLQQMKYLKAAHAYHIHIYEEQIMTLIPFFASLTAHEA